MHKYWLKPSRKDKKDTGKTASEMQGGSDTFIKTTDIH